MKGFAMWTEFTCCLSGRHDYRMWCEPGAIFLRCVECGKRSPGWALEAKPYGVAQGAAAAPAIAPPSAFVTPLDRAAAS